MLRRTLTVAAVAAALVTAVAATPANAAPTGKGFTIIGISDVNGTTIQPRPAGVAPIVSLGSRAPASTSHSDAVVSPAATGGGCTTTNNVPTCISWGTGQGLKSNFFLDAYNPAQKGGSARLYMEVCLSGTTCNLLFGYSATLDHTGVYPTFTVQPGSGTHGTAWTVVYIYTKAGAFQFSTTSPNENW